MAAIGPADPDATPKPKKGKPIDPKADLLWYRWTKPFQHAKNEGEIGVAVAGHHLALKMTVAPETFHLADVHQVKVTLQVLNNTKKFVQLEFPTTQRIEVIVKNKAGKLVEQWSEDRAFTNEAGVVSVNPGEHLEYSAMLATRDMVGGETYTVEAFFPNYEPLRASKTISPVK
jgi:uncharacterized protein YndB with AHSA1/START domain